LEILLNGTPLEIEGIDSEVTILQLIEVVEESLKGTGSTVIEIILDGEAYSPDESDKLSELLLASFAKVEITAATATDMVRAAFEDGEAGVDHLEELAHAVASELRIGKIKPAMDSYVEFVDGVEWLVTMLNNAHRAFAAGMAESSVEADRQQLLVRMSEQMAGVQSAQESEDWVGVADILEYEFPEIFVEARRLIAKILECSG